MVLFYRGEEGYITSIIGNHPKDRGSQSVVSNGWLMELRCVSCLAVITESSTITIWHLRDVEWAHVLLIMAVSWGQESLVVVIGLSLIMRSEVAWHSPTSSWGYKWSSITRSVVKRCCLWNVIEDDIFKWSGVVVCFFLALERPKLVLQWWGSSCRKSKTYRWCRISRWCSWPRSTDRPRQWANDRVWQELDRNCNVK